MTTTTNYGMQLPSGSDPSDITPINQNTTFLDTKLKELEDVTDSVIDEIDKTTSSTSGSIVTLTDEAPLTPLKSCVCDIEPVQASGTPSPDNPLAISGWSGVNVSTYGVNLFPDSSNWESGTIGTDGQDTTGNFYRTKGYWPIKGGYNYTYFYSGDSVSFRVFFYDKDQNFLTYLSANPMSVPSNARYFRARWSNTPTITNIQLELGSTATTYADLNGSTTTLTWTDAGTVYGGSIDLTSGELTVTRAFAVLDGTESGWTGSSLKAGSFYRSWDEFNPKGYSTGYSATPFVCSHLKFNANFNTYVAGECYSDRTCSLFFPNVSTLEEFKQLLATEYANGTPVTICYKLATPLTYQLTPTTVKTLSSSPTNIWADTGDTSITYVVKDKYSYSGIPTVEAVKNYIMNLLGI